MATLSAVLQSIRQQVVAATQGLVSSAPDTTGVPINVEVGLYWPSARTLQDNVRKVNNDTGNLTALVTIFDRGLAQDSTRFVPYQITAILTPATITVAVNGSPITPTSPDPYIDPGVPATIALGGVVTPGDAVAVLLYTVRNDQHPITIVGVAGDTPNTMAAKLAAAISADPWMASVLTATATGPVVTLQNTQLTPINLTVNYGNGGFTLREIGRRKRHFQIVVWTRTPDDRWTVSDPIEQMIAESELNFGPTFSDGTMGRLTFYGDVLRDDATLSDTLRRDFLVCIDYPITETDAAYAVLAPISPNTIF